DPGDINIGGVVVKGSNDDELFTDDNPGKVTLSGSNETIPVSVQGRINVSCEDYETVLFESVSKMVSHKAMRKADRGCLVSNLGNSPLEFATNMFGVTPNELVLNTDPRWQMETPPTGFPGTFSPRSKLLTTSEPECIFDVAQ